MLFSINYDMLSSINYDMLACMYKCSLILIEMTGLLIIQLIFAWPNGNNLGKRRQYTFFTLIEAIHFHLISNK